MVTRILPYVAYVDTAARGLVPNYEKFRALGFIVSLLAETYVRFSKKASDATLAKITTLKTFQIADCLISNPTSSSYKVVIPTMILTMLNFTDSQAGITTDRPSFVSFLGCSQEIINIASKVIQSLAAGLVAQQVFTGQTEGKIRTVVSVALLGLSALNVYCKVEVKPVLKVKS